jgi:23S rRNA pseudouridine1911/1915/1917 synthase
MLNILHEDTDLLALNKPAGLVCHPTKGDVYSSLISRVRLYLGEGASVHLVNRIDRETSGVVLAAKNPVAAGELGKLWEARAVRKEYLAIVHGSLESDCGTIDLPLGKDEQSEVAIKDCVRPDGAAAQTDFSVERRFQREGRDFTLARLSPRTGRKHQIRIHLAGIGHPIVGDKLYGADKDAYLAFVKERLTPEQRALLILDNHALHAESLCLTWRGDTRIFSAPPDEAFQNFLHTIPVS